MRHQNNDHSTFLLSILENHKRNQPSPLLQNILDLPEAEFEALDFNLTVQDEYHPNYGMSFFWMACELAIDGKDILLKKILLLDNRLQTLDFNATVQNPTHPTQGATILLLACSLALKGNYLLLEKIFYLPDDCFQKLDFNTAIQNLKHMGYKMSALHAICILATHSKAPKLLEKILLLPDDHFQALELNQIYPQEKRSVLDLAFMLDARGQPGFLEKIIELSPNLDFFTLLGKAATDPTSLDRHPSLQEKLLKMLEECFRAPNFNITVPEEHPFAGADVLFMASILARNEKTALLERILELPDQHFQLFNFNATPKNENCIAYGANTLWIACELTTKHPKLLQRILQLPDKDFQALNFNPINPKSRAGVLMMAVHFATATDNYTVLLKRIFSLPKDKIQNLILEPRSFYSDKLIEVVLHCIFSEKGCVNALSFLCHLSDSSFKNLMADTNTEPLSKYKSLITLIDILRTVINSEASELNEVETSNINEALTALQATELGSEKIIKNSVYYFLANVAQKKYGVILVELLQKTTIHSPQLFAEACQTLAEYYFTIESINFAERLTNLLNAMEYSIKSYAASPSDLCFTLIIKIVCAYWSTREDNIGKTLGFNEKHDIHLNTLKELLKEKTLSASAIKEWAIARREVFVRDEIIEKQEKEIEALRAQLRGSKNEPPTGPGPITLSIGLFSNENLEAQRPSPNNNKDILSSSFGQD